MAAKSEKGRAGEAARKMRNAIRTLKDKIAGGREKTAERDKSPAEVPADAPATPPASGAVAVKPGEVGTSGAWSVETRYPSPPAIAASSSGKTGGPQPRGRLLSRAGQAVRHVGGGSWGGVVALCAIAFALVAAALAVRRSRHSA